MTSLHRALIGLSCVLAIAACGTRTERSLPTVSGGLSAVRSIDLLVSQSTRGFMIRKAALLGVFVSEYISFSSTALAAQGGLTGIAVDTQIIDAQHSVTDPDFDLLQAFADALQVDVADLLNRSTDRQKTLDTYATALSNVANRANERFKELTGSLEEINETLRAQNRELSTAQSDLNKAISNKDFSDAGEKQKILLDAQEAEAETDLKRKQTEQVVRTFDTLLTLYGEKILAIQKNREVLIAGNKVVDVPGIEDLKILERQRTPTRPGGGGGQFDGLFEGM